MTYDSALFELCQNFKMYGDGIHLKIYFVGNILRKLKLESISGNCDYHLGNEDSGNTHLKTE